MTQCDFRRMTVTELADRYCCRHFELSSGSKYLFKRAAASFSEWWLTRQARACPTLLNLNDDAVCQWLGHRRERASRATVKRERKDLLKMWRWAAAQGWCDPPGEIPVIRLLKTLPKAIRIDKLEHCIQICSELRGVIRGTQIPRAVFYPALLMFLFETGARIGAALAITRDQVCWDRCCVTLEADPSKTGLEQILWITPRTRDMLRKLIACSPVTSKGHVGDLLFHCTLSRSAIHKTYRKVREKAGLPKQREGFHRIRATHATIVTARCGIELAAHQLGHASTQTTWDRYVDRAMLAELRGERRAIDALPPIAINVGGAQQMKLF